MEDPNAFPMVAIRTAGLSFESLVGVLPNRMQDGADGDMIEEHITRIASEVYLELLISIANERFNINTERMRRFERDLFKREEGLGSVWEDSKSRQERKRAKGLAQQQTLQKTQEIQKGGSFCATGVDETADVTELSGSLLLP